MADQAGDTEAGRMFDQLFSRYAPDLQVVAEDDGHRAFITDLFLAGSPLRGVLPEPVVLQQAAIRDIGYRADFPSAMRRIVVARNAPIGRIMIDWSVDDAALLVDIAVLPERQGMGTATAMMQAYLDVADMRGQRTMLQVAPDNPAIRLYTRMGFVPVETAAFAPYLDMVREPRA